MALMKRTRTYEVYTWAEQPTADDTITVMLASGASVVLRGIGANDGYKICAPAFRVDAAKTDMNIVNQLRRAAKARLKKSYELAWIDRHVEFVIQPKDYDQGVDETSNLRVGCSLYVYLMIDKELVRDYEVEYGKLAIQVHGGSNLDVITQQFTMGSSTIVSIE